MLIPCLVFLRTISALVLATSFLPARVLSWRFRLMLAIVVTALVTPALMTSSPLAVGDMSTVSSLVVSEMLRGACFGFGLCLWLMGAEVCAAVWGQLSGISLDTLLAGHRPAIVRFFQLVWISVFFVTGGHRTAARVVLDSFQWAPPGTPLDGGDTLESVFVLLGVSVQLGLQAGMPLVTTLLATLSLTVLMSRLLPHLQTLVTSTSLGALALVVSLAVGCGPLARTLQLQVGSFLATWGDQLSAVKPP